MLRMKYRLTGCLLPLILFASAPAPAADPWQATTQNGNIIQVDPNTNRTTITTPEGVSTQIWDGVHRLEDGSTITTNRGVVVPNTRILESRQWPKPRRELVSTEPSRECLMLQTAVCGSGDTCADTEACRFARQLVTFDVEESLDINAGVVVADKVVPGQCREAFNDRKQFPPCKH
jgi:hypothetical protein